MNGSQIAKSGFNNEFEIVELFNKKEKFFLQEFQSIYRKNIIRKNIFAEKIKGSKKPDIRIFIDQEEKTVSVKKYQQKAGYNHLARTSVAKFCNKLNLSDLTYNILSIFTGEKKPNENSFFLKNKNYNKKRVVMHDIKKSFVQQVVDELAIKQEEILKWAFLGDNEVDYFIFSAESVTGIKQHHCFDKKQVLDFYRKGFCKITPRGSINIGNNITLQRKGGTGTPTNIQVKFKPQLIVESY